MDAIFVPILFALSDISEIAVLAISAAFSVLPPKLETREAANDVDVSM